MKKIRIECAILLSLILLGTEILSSCSQKSQLLSQPQPTQTVTVQQEKKDSPTPAAPQPSELWKWGYMDTTGKLAISPRFDGAEPFFDGVARVIVDERVGYINHKGEYVILPQFNIQQFFNGIDDFVEDRLPMKLKPEGKIGYIDKTGEFVISPQFDEVESFSNGRALVCSKKDEYTDKCGYIDPWGKLVIPLKFRSAWTFHQGVAAVSVPSQGRRAAKYYEGVLTMIDRLGNYLVEPILDQINTLPEWGNPPDVKFYDGLVLVRVVDEVGDTSYSFNPKWAGKWGYVSQKGGFAIPPRFTRAENFSQGRALVQIADDATEYDSSWRGEIAMIDTRGQIIDTRTQNPKPSLSNTLRSTSLTFSEGLAAVKADNQLWGYINPEGRWAILPQFKAKPGTFAQGLAPVATRIEENGQIKSRVGFINKTGEFVIAPQFDSSYRGFFDNGLAIVSIGGREGVVGGKKGLIDKQGRFVLAPKFYSISNFVEGVARARLVEGGSVYYINSSGQVLPEYKNSGDDFAEGLVLVKVKVSPSDSRE